MEPTMDFVSAIKEVKEGKKVRRASWEDKKANITMSAGVMSLKKEDGNYHPWMISEPDIYAQDWEVVLEN